MNSISAKFVINLNALLIISVVLLSFKVSGQIARGKLLSQDIPGCIDSFFIDRKMDLEKLRSTSDFLTNRHITTYQSQILPKRKKAFKRHVKHLNEFAEQCFIDKVSQNMELSETIYELYLLDQSFKNKAISNASKRVSIAEKLNMLYSTLRSRQAFKYKIPTNEQFDLDQAIAEPLESPFYHPIDSGRPMHKQFAYLAKEKKVKQRENMVLLYRPSELDGSVPKINALDINLDDKWNLKWGDEIHSDIIGSRIFAALGYDVDHPYIYGENELTLVFDEETNVNSHEDLKEMIQGHYKIDLSPFISNHGTVSTEMAAKNKKLTPFVGKPFVQFVKCGIEARPDRVKRLGSFLPADSINANRRELNGALLIHHFIGNWDTKEANTLLSTVHLGNHMYRISGVFSDLGASLGVSRSWIRSDFKAGLINELEWKAVKKKGSKIIFTNRINAILPAYANAEYEDLYWMATKLAKIDEYNLKKIIRKAHLPKPVSELYFNKLASRRASILEAFEISDPNPIKFDNKISISENGVEVVKNGKLICDYNRNSNPESFTSRKGRYRNYGN